MNINDIPIYADVTLVDYTLDDISDFPGDWENDDNDFLEVLYNATCGHMGNAMGRLEPLFQGREIKYFFVCFEILRAGQGAAGGYNYEFSSEEKGNHQFYINPSMIWMYLAHHWSKDESHLKGTELFWEHEFLHMLDYSQVAAFRYNDRSTDHREFIVKHLLSFRNEGIADLFWLMKGNSAVKDMKTARQRFAKELKRMEDLPWEDPSLTEQLKDSLFNTSISYSLGHWMVLHAISALNTESSDKPIIDVVKDIEKGRIFEDDQVIDIARIALKLTNQAFLQALIQPAYDGVPFANPERLFTLINRINKTGKESVAVAVDQEAVFEREKLLNFFNRVWPV